MGYELKLKVGTIHPAQRDQKGREWFNDECEIDLSCCGRSNVGDLADSFMIKKGKPVLYWYEGHVKKSEDSYGYKPMPIPTKSVIQALRKDVKVLDHGDNDRPYRRFEWALSLLEAIEKRDDGEKKEFCVIFEGH
jgi:hypothetical protein